MLGLIQSDSAKDTLAANERKEGDMISDIFQCVLGRAFGILAIVLPVVVAFPSQAQTFSVLHNFNSPWPHGNLVRDAAGNLYLVQAYTVFKLDTGGTMTSLSTFAPDPLHGGPVYGTGLNSVLMMDSAGNLYGTTPQGGLVDCFITGPGLPITNVGCGTVFKLDPLGQKTVLYKFAGGNTGPDGAFPNADLIRDQTGYVYGTTSGGGPNDCALTGLAMGCGIVFKLDTNGNEIILNNYGRATGGLVLDTAGNLYGISIDSVFKLDKTGAFTQLYTFTGGTDGWDPQGNLAIDSSGNLYGATNMGGASSCVSVGGAIGCGVVFKVDPSGKESVLYSFTGGSSDGANPKAGVLLDAAGNIYGTTSQGGPANAGTVFKLDSTGTETLLHSFTGDADGGGPGSELVLDSAGNLYGSTSSGGDPTCGSGGCGVIFKIVPATPDFSISASGLSPGTIIAGSSSTSNLSIAAITGFNGSVTLSCWVQPSPPQAPQCSISPNSVSPGMSAMLTVTTTAPRSTLNSNFEPGLFYSLLLLLGFLAVGTFDTQRKRIRALLIPSGFLFSVLMFQTACGGGSSPIQNRAALGTPAGSYTVTVMATDTSGALQHSTTTTVTVQ